jgi:hypothetical protein
VGETLKRRVGFLPVWAWALLFVIVLALYLSYKKKKAAAAAAAAQQQAANNLSSNLGTVPLSNLSTAAQPMPIQLGDTFVSTTVPNTVNVSPTTTVMPQPAPAYALQPTGVPAPSPAVVPSSEPGYGSGLAALLGLNPGLLSANSPGGQNIPGITGYQVSYNGVPL